MLGYQRIGELLVQSGHLTREQVDTALQAQATTGGRFGALLVSLGLVEEAVVTRALAQQYELELADLSERPDPEALKLVDVNTANSRMVLPLAARGATLVVAVSDPLDIVLTDELQHRTGLRVKLCLATPSALREAIRDAYLAPRRPRATKRPVKIDPQLDRAELLSALEAA